MERTYAILAPVVLAISGIVQLWAWQIRQKGFYKDQEEIRALVIKYRKEHKIHWWNFIAHARSNNLATVLRPTHRADSKALQRYASISKVMSWEATGWSTLVVGTIILVVLAVTS